MGGKKRRKHLHGLPALLCLVFLTHSAAAKQRPCGLEYFGTDGNRLAYRACGKGEPVVIVPGGPGLDAGYMSTVAEWIAADGHRAILFEPRGTGASRAALGDGSRLTVADSVADVEALRVAIGAPRIALIGHSFGGGVVQAYAAAHAHRVARLVLLDSVGPDMRPSPVPQDSWHARLSPAELADYDTARQAGDRKRAMKIKFIGSFVDRKRGEAFVATLHDDMIYGDISPLADRYRAEYSITNPPKLPVMILAGEADWIRAAEPALRRTYPNARVRSIPRAGHFPWADAPASTRQALRWALKR